MLNYEVDRSALTALVPRGTELDCDVGRVYGEEFTRFLLPRPASAFLAEGSEVAVSRGVRLVG
jgi:hypothetical protein